MFLWSSSWAAGFLASNTAKLQCALSTVLHVIQGYPDAAASRIKNYSTQPVGHNLALSKRGCDDSIAEPAPALPVAGRAARARCVCLLILYAAALPPPPALLPPLGYEPPGNGFSALRVWDYGACWAAPTCMVPMLPSREWPHSQAVTFDSSAIPSMSSVSVVMGDGTARCRQHKRGCRSAESAVDSQARPGQLFICNLATRPCSQPPVLHLQSILSACPSNAWPLLHCISTDNTGLPVAQSMRRLHAHEGWLACAWRHAN